jgi:hypothetical protein
MGLSQQKCAALGMRKMAHSIRQTIPAWTYTNNILPHAMPYHLIEECQPFPIIITAKLA